MTKNMSRGQIEGLVRFYLDDRLAYANEPPGIREAVIQDVFGRAETIEQRIREQVDQLRSPSSQRIPDAYFNDEEEIENAIQLAAAGIRSAFAQSGFLTDDPRRFEAGYAFSLAPSARWAILDESSRVPRPRTRHNLLARFMPVIPWQDDESEWPPPAAVKLEGIRRLAGQDARPVRVAESPYLDWIQVGMFERQATLASTYPKQPSRQVIIVSGLEITDGTSIGTDSLPVGTNSPNIWTTPYERLLPGVDQGLVEEMMKALQGPLAMIANYRGHRSAPHRDRGVGLLPFSLVPRLELVAFLDLRPESPTVRQCLVDDQGPAIVGRNWRGFPIHDGSYSPLVPAVHGTDLIVRPDLYELLEDKLNKNRIQSGITVRYFEDENDDMEYD